MLGLVIVLLLIGVINIIYISLTVEPSDLQVATRYTAFGDTNFYRNKWYYLLSFILFTVALLGTHIALAVKLYGRQQKYLAIGTLAMTGILLLAGWLIARSVFRIAFL